MTLRLAEHPELDRPRERFWLRGPAALTAQELLAILLGTGTRGRDALAVAADVLRTSDGSLRLGGNYYWGEYFAGYLDDVRVYRRALTAAEIHADMTRPVKGV